jgi:hypothetical protein
MEYFYLLVQSDRQPLAVSKPAVLDIRSKYSDHDKKRGLLSLSQKIARLFGKFCAVFCSKEINVLNEQPPC